MSMSLSFVLYMVAVVALVLAFRQAPTWTVRPRADRPAVAAGIIAVWIAAGVAGYLIPEIIHQRHLTNLAPYTSLGPLGWLAQLVGVVGLVTAAVHKTPLFAFVAGFAGVVWGVLSLIH